MKINSIFRSTFLFFPIFLTVIFIVPSTYGQGTPGPIVYSVPGMDKVKVHPDIVYKRDGRDEMKMDIFIPPDLESGTRLPAVVFVHGGPLPSGMRNIKDADFFRSYGKLMAASGFAGVTFNHRFTGIDPKAMEISFSDVETAIQFIRSKSSSYHIDPDRIALWVFSGGGTHLSVALHNRMKFIRCMVSYYGLLDIRTLAQLTRQAPPESFERYNPITYLTKDYDYRPPVFIACAGRDYLPQINLDANKFVSRMRSLNSDIKLLIHPSGRHGFDYLNNDDQSRHIIKETVIFLKNHLNQ